MLQYADDTPIYSADKNLFYSNSKLSQNIERLVHFFKMHPLTLNAKKT